MKTVFFGTPDFAVAALDAIMHSTHEVAAVVTVPDRQSGRGRKTTPSAVKQYAVDHQLPLLQPERLRDEEFLRQLAAFQADIFVVVAFRMLPEAVWNMPPHGTFNLHASLLPRYRGAAPINWAIINGDTTTGVTTFLLNHHIDEGAILLQQPTPITPDDNAGTLHDRLAAIGSRLVVDTLDRLADGTLSPQPQQGTPCPAPKIFKDDCRIDFTRTAKATVDFIRGLSPYPAAFMTLLNPHGEAVDFKVFEATAKTQEGSVPGDIQCDGKHTLKIGVADGFILISSLQMSGKRRNSIEEFLRGTNLSGWKTNI